MLEQINWSTYTGADFQLFCSALLGFEFGHKFIPYTAPGKDNGIDGSFEGVYNDLSGKWRFQCKFHNTPRRTAASSLKADIKNDIANIAGENHLIFLSNVELSPTERDSLNRLYDEETADLTSKPSFELWDGAKIYNIYLKFPILQMWLTEGFTTAQLVPYRVRFEKWMKAPMEKSYTLGNFYAPRKDKMEELRNFLTSEKAVMLLSGEAGIGKTRLVIEFFKELEKEDNYSLLALQATTINYDKIYSALQGDEKFVILADEANELTNSVTTDLVRLAESLSPRVKVIFTERNIRISSFKEKLKVYEQHKIEYLDIDRLSRDETKALFAHELGDHLLKNFIDDLAQISHGKPILIVAILKAAIKNLPIAEIKKDTFFTDNVQDNFRTYTETVTKKTSLNNQQVADLLLIISLIEPLSLTDSQTLDEVSSYLIADRKAVSAALDLLKEGRYVAGVSLCSIKPDFYSDVIIRSAGKERVKDVVLHFIRHLTHMVSNLAASQDQDSPEQSLLDDMLDPYILLMRTTENMGFVSELMENINSISYTKPGAGKKAIELFFECLKNEASPIFQDYLKYNRHYLESSDSPLDKVRQILWTLLYYPEEYNYVFKTVLCWYEFTQDAKRWISVYEFSKRDFIDRYTFKKQLYFISRVKKKLQIFQKGHLLFIIGVLKNFMQLEFRSSGSYSPATHTLTIVTYYLPENTRVKKLRIAVIELLILIYTESEDFSVKMAVITELLDIPRGILATENNNKPYKGDEELTAILDFLIGHAETVPQGSQKDVLEKMALYKRWKIDSSFYPKLLAIQDGLRPRNLTEELIRVFTRSEDAMIDFGKSDGIMFSQSKVLIESSTETELALALKNLYDIHEKNYYFLQSLVEILARQFPEKSKKIYDILWDQSPPVIYQFGPIILEQQFFVYGDNDFFFHKVQELQNENSWQADNVLLAVYSCRTAETYVMQTSDFDIIKKIIEKNNDFNLQHLSRAIIPYLIHNNEDGIDAALQVAGRLSQRAADMFFLFLSEIADGYYPQFKKVFTEGSIQFDMNFYLERGLSKILVKDGPEEVFLYLLRRFEHKRKVFKSTKSLINYEFVPIDDHSQLYNDLPEDKSRYSHQLFKIVLEWYISGNFDAAEAYFAADFLKYIRREKNMDDQTYSLFIELISLKKGSKSSILKILAALATYETKSTQSVDLIFLLYEQGHEIGEDDPKFLEDLHSAAFLAITQLGVMMGTPGEPFQVEVELKYLLEQRLEAIEQSDPSFSFIKAIIKSLDSSIKSSVERDKESW